MVGQQHILRFAATEAQFEPAFADWRAALDACGVTGRPRFNAELAFEEIVSNIIRHGGDDRSSRHIVATLACEPAVLVLTFDDDGVPFDPLSRAMATLPTSLEEAPLGGLGLLLLHKTSRQLHYERTADHKNRLTVTIDVA